MPNGVFDSDLEAIFSNIIPKWKYFISALIKQKNKQTLDCSHSDSHSEENDQETSWLITSEPIEEICVNRYYAYQIVYSFINRTIITQEERNEACQLVLRHLSKLSRKIMRSMRKTEIKILSLSKFTALIDVGLWSDVDDYEDPSKYYRDYEDLYEDPKVYFSYHEPNFQKFLDIEFIRIAFPLKEYRNDVFMDKILTPRISEEERAKNKYKKDLMDKLQDLMLTFPTLLIVQNRKEEALY